MRTVREFLKGLGETGPEYFGHKNMRTIHSWLSHGQIPFKAADKILEALFYEELDTTSAPLPPQTDVANDPSYNAEVWDGPEEVSPEQPLSWAELAVINARRNEEKRKANLPAGHVEKAKEIVPGALEPDPMEQSEQSFTVPGGSSRAMRIDRRNMSVVPRRVPGHGRVAPQIVPPRRAVATTVPRNTGVGQPRPPHPPGRLGWMYRPGQKDRAVQPPWTEPHPPPPEDGQGR